MPHRCLRCGKVYHSFKGIERCECGSRVFLYFRRRDELEREEVVELLERLEVETIAEVEEGRYVLDLSALLRGEPIVIRDKDGVYHIDLRYALRLRR